MNKKVAVIGGVTVGLAVVATGLVYLGFSFVTAGTDERTHGMRAYRLAQRSKERFTAASDKVQAAVSNARVMTVLSNARTIRATAADVAAGMALLASSSMRSEAYEHLACDNTTSDPAC